MKFEYYTGQTTLMLGEGDDQTPPQCAVQAPESTPSPPKCYGDLCEHLLPRDPEYLQGRYAGQREKREWGLRRCAFPAQGGRRLENTARCSVRVGGMSSTIRSPKSTKRKAVDATEVPAPKSPRKAKTAQADAPAVGETVLAANTPAKPADPTHSSKLHTLIVRTITGLVMMFGFILIMFSDHAIITGFVVLLQIMVYREMTLLRYREAKEKDIPLFRSLAWYVAFTRSTSSSAFCFKGRL